MTAHTEGVNKWADSLEIPTENRKSVASFGRICSDLYFLRMAARSAPCLYVCRYVCARMYTCENVWPVHVFQPSNIVQREGVSQHSNQSDINDL